MTFACRWHRKALLKSNFTDLIDQPIDRSIDWSLTEHPWDRRGLTSGPIQYKPIQYSLCFVFVFFMCRSLRHREGRNTHRSIINEIQWLSMNSKYVCQSFSEQGWEGSKWVSKHNTAIYGPVWMLQAPDGLHHRIDSTDVFFSDAVVQTKGSRGSCSLHWKDTEKLQV